jgi:hypothetical protein
MLTAPKNAFNTRYKTKKIKENYIKSYGHKLISNRKYTTFICKRKTTNIYVTRHV